MARAGTAAHRGHVQLRDILPGAAVAHRPSILLAARVVEGLDHTAGLQDIRMGQEAPAALVHRAREPGRRIDSEEAAYGRNTAARAETDADNRRRLLQWEDDRTGRIHTTHMVGPTAAAQGSGSCTGPQADHHDLPWHQDLVSEPGTTENPPLFRGRLHRVHWSKRTSRSLRGCVRLTSGRAGLYGSFRS